MWVSGSRPQPLAPTARHSAELPPGGVRGRHLLDHTLLRRAVTDPAWQIWNKPEPGQVLRATHRPAIRAENCFRSRTTPSRARIAGKDRCSPGCGDVSRVAIILRLLGAGIRHYFRRTAALASLRPRPPPATSARSSGSHRDEEAQARHQAPLDLRDRLGIGAPDSRGINKGLHGQAQMLND